MVWGKIADKLKHIKGNASTQIKNQGAIMYTGSVLGDMAMKTAKLVVDMPLGVLKGAMPTGKAFGKKPAMMTGYLGTLMQTPGRMLGYGAKQAVKGVVPMAPYLAKGAGESLHATWTAGYHGAKNFGKFVFHKDKTSLLGYSLKPGVSDIAILGAGAAGFGMANRSARINTELGYINLSPIEGTIGGQAINSPLPGYNQIKPSIADFGCNGQLALNLSKLRGQGFLNGSGGIHG